MGDQHVGWAELHRRTVTHRSELSRSQVYEFVAGTREVQVEAADAMLKALCLGVVPTERR